MDLDLASLDAVETLSLFRSGKLSPVEYAEAVVERAEQKAELNSLQFIDPEYVVRAAHESIERHPDGALAGLPLVVKDNINTTAYPTSGCTMALLKNTPRTDAGSVQKLTNQGAFVGAKAGMHELAFGITSNNAATGAIRNPHDPSLIAGGSSGGTAAAIAAGIFPAGLGTDTGGSCRIPASLCGTVGFRPSLDRYDGDGMIPNSRSRDVVGPLAKTMRDIILLDGIMAPNSAAPEELDPSSITLGVPRQHLYDNLEGHTEQVIEAQLEALQKAGFNLVDVSLEPIWPHKNAFSFPVVFYEMMQDIPAYLKEHAPDISFEDLIKGVASPDVAFALAHHCNEGRISDEEYRTAMEVHRPAMLKIYGRVYEENGLDALVFPTTPLTARPVGQDDTVDVNGAEVPTFETYHRNTDLASTIGAPGLSLPCPVSSGLPVGIEFDALPGSDRQLLSIARAAERAMAN